MPVVFSPGEVAVKPVDPDQIVYTTPQKVADLLNIAPGEPVLLAADASSGQPVVAISGTDYREHGFEAGDTVLLYDDNSPLGEEVEVSAVGQSGGNVTLTMTGNISISLTTAANAVAQNQLSFTNGKSRGVKRSHVEQRIKEVQDRIDNITHNAWRPYLVAAEYVNFDTYKPYRRRYYTDYVGTTPLLFRNVQQILRIELWQGDSYREIAGAEARVKIVDYQALSDAGVVIAVSPGDGGVASLTHSPTPTNVTWTARLDNVTSAQSLADLINKDERTNKGPVTFTPTFNYEDSTATSGLVSASVHHEFLATANSDYGNGIVKITSKKSSKGGETASIGSDDLTNLEISQVATKTATSGVHATGVKIDNALGYPVSHSTAMTTDGTAATTPFATGDSIYKSDGTLIGVLTAVGASSLTVEAGIAVSLDDDDEIYSGRLQNVTDPATLVVDSTSGFAKVGILMIVNGADTSLATYTGKTSTTFTGISTITNFLSNVGGSSGSGAKGTTITQYLFSLDLQGASGDEARLRDWWLDSEMGIIYFNNSYPFFEWNAVKVSYIYGERYLEKAIEEAATKLVACDLLMADDRSILIPEGTSNVDLASKIQLWRQEAEGMLNRYKEVVLFE